MLAFVLLFLCAAVKGDAYHDIYRQDDLEQVVQRHAKHSQIFLFAYMVYPDDSRKTMWLDMVAELCTSLTAFEYPYVVLTHDAAACDDLLAQVADRVSPPPPCILNSVLEKTSAYDGRTRSKEGLWIRRYHAAQLFSQAGVGFTLLDTDTIIVRDFLPELIRFEREFALVVLREGIANGGMWHLRASSIGSAALWIVRQVERRSFLFAQYSQRFSQTAGWAIDQEIIQDAIRIAADPEASAFDFWENFWATANKNHALWKQFPQKRFEHTFEWKNGTVESSPYLVVEPRWDAAAHARYDAFANQYGLRGSPLLYADIRVPFNSDEYDERAPPERVLRAPEWLWNRGDVYVQGFVDQAAAYHLLNVNLDWSDKGYGGHVGRYAQWLARPGMTSHRETHNKRYIGISTNARAEWHTKLGMRHAVKHLVDYALGVGAMPVLPRFACNSSWIAQGGRTFLGHDDHRVVDDGTWCHPSPPGGDACLPGEHFVYQFMVPQGADVEWLEDLPRSYTMTGDVGRAHSACESFFKYFS